MVIYLDVHCPKLRRGQYGFLPAIDGSIDDGGEGDSTVLLVTIANYKIIAVFLAHKHGRNLTFFHGVLPCPHSQDPKWLGSIRQLSTWSYEFCVILSI